MPAVQAALSLFFLRKNPRFCGLLSPLTLTGAEPYRPASPGMTRLNRLVRAPWRLRFMQRQPWFLVASLAVLACSGCAHHRLGSNGYAYEPPLAPAVYPQPVDASQPVAPVVTTGVPTISQTAVPPQVVMPQPVAGQPVYSPVVGGPATMVPCDPATMTAPLQTQPCPPPAL
jgi:hypothetical protein